MDGWMYLWLLFDSCCITTTVQEERFSEETGIAMAGALKYQDVVVKDVMMPLENTFMIDVEDKLNFDTSHFRVRRSERHRTAVYEGSYIYRSGR